MFSLEDCLKWIIHPLWASVFSSLKWKCWARGRHGPNMLCLGDKPRFGPFQPCFASTHNVQQNFIILPNGYSQFSVLQSFVWKRKCPPNLVLLLSSGCYSKRERERDKALWKVDPRGLLSRFAVWFFPSSFLTNQRVWLSWKWHLTVQMLIIFIGHDPRTHFFVCRPQNSLLVRVFTWTSLGLVSPYGEKGDFRKVLCDGHLITAWPAQGCLW